MTSRTLPARVAAGLLVLGAGCGGQEPGPTRYSLSGTVTYQEQPVPAGVIHFYPDDSQGNNGPGTQADIKDGRYETPPGKGTVGGPHRVRIIGYDGQPREMQPLGQQLFGVYEATVDLPKDDAAHDFAVPAERP